MSKWKWTNKYKIHFQFNVSVKQYSEKYPYPEVEVLIESWSNVLIKRPGSVVVNLEGSDATGLVEQIDQGVGVLAPPAAEVSLVQVDMQQAPEIIHLGLERFENMIQI